MRNLGGRHTRGNCGGKDRREDKGSKNNEEVAAPSVTKERKILAVQARAARQPTVCSEIHRSPPEW